MARKLGLPFDPQPMFAASNPAPAAYAVIAAQAVGGGDLACTGTSTTAGFVSGVEDMQVWYGETDGSRVQYRAEPVADPGVAR